MADGPVNRTILHGAVDANETIVDLSWKALEPERPLPLVITVESSATGARAEHAFDKSPVRIGRSKLNDLCLDDTFVSEFHALVDLDREPLILTDLGSLNGTIVDGVRLGRRFKKESVEVGLDVRLRIGPFHLTLGRQQVAPQPPIQHQTQFALKAIGARPSDRGPGAPARRRSEPSLAAAADGGAGSAVDPTLGEASLRLIRDFGASYLAKSETLSTPESLEQFLDRVAQLLETFGRSFVELRKGYQEFGKEMGIRTGGQDNNLNRARDLPQVLAYLLDTSRGSRLEELQSGFADLMIHQVALLGAVVEGVRAILGRLSPEAIAAAVDASSKGASKVALGVPLFREKALWQAYASRFHDLADEENSISDALFGSDFAKAYHNIVGRRHGEEEEEAPKKEETP